MKKIFLIAIILIGTNTSLYAKQNCNELPGFKKVGKDSVEYIKCLKDQNKKFFKLNTDSKLTDWFKKVIK